MAFAAVRTSWLMPHFHAEPRRMRSEADGDLEMQAAPQGSRGQRQAASESAATAPQGGSRRQLRIAADRDASEAGEASRGAAHHGREASGRSVLSGISDRLATLRRRDREHTQATIEARLESEDQAQASRARVEAELARHARTSPGAAYLLGRMQMTADVGGGGGSASATNDAKDKPKSRREKEEAVTLFGPNLANYFGSGSSSSGAVSGGSIVQPSSGGGGFEQSAFATQPANLRRMPSDVQGPSSAAVAAVAAAGGSGSAPSSLAARKARLGSRGRARGASLSGLSHYNSGLGLGLEGGSSASLAAGVVADPSSAEAEHAAAPGELADPEAVAMAEGIELDTLKRWIERSVGGGVTEIDGGGGATITNSTNVGSAGPAVCSTLQSYVNLKRNTVKLRVAEGTEGGLPASPATAASALDGLPMMQHLRSATSLTASSLRLGATAASPASHPLTPTASGMGGSLATAAAPPTTHHLQFEYDCAAPFASVQVFLRASRKHGSWVAWMQGKEASGSVEAPADGFYAQRHVPPPHILGWPVYSARLKRGFGEPLRANLALRLEYYAPPNPTTTTADKGQASDKGAGDATAVSPHEARLRADAAAAAAVTETPTVERNQAELEEAQQQHETLRPSPEAVAVVGSGVDERGGASAAAREDAHRQSQRPEPPSPAAGLPESREARLAREKAERETLKLAIVVEALDEDGKPLREPNLQTTYMRLVSLPAKQVSGTTIVPADDAETGALALPTSEQAQATRVWSAQVEGQEAEIGPHRFQLQELYGLSTRPPPVKAAPPEGQEGDEGGRQGDASAGGAAQGGEGGTGGGGAADASTTVAAATLDMEGSDGSECLICLTSPPTTLLLPCTHGLCLECAVQLRESVKKQRETDRRRGRTPKRKFNCPVCRRAYTSMLHLAMADEKEFAQASA